MTIKEFKNITPEEEWKLQNNCNYIKNPFFIEKGEAFKDYPLKGETGFQVFKNKIIRYLVKI